jgi:uncharacterized protein involved in exopolysaccharide biosynthesis
MNILNIIIIFAKIFKRPMTLILAAVIGSALSFGVYEFIVPSYYVARARVLVIADIKGRSAPRQGETFSEKSLNTAAQMLKNRDTLEEVVKELKLQESFKKSDAKAQLASTITIKPVEETNILEVSVRAKNAEFATLIANTLCNLAVNRSIKDRFSFEKDLRVWLNEQSRSIKKELGDSRNRLLEFKKTCGSADPEAAYNGAKNQLGGIEQALALVKKEKEQDEMAYDRIRLLLKEGKPLEELPEVQNDAGYKALKGEHDSTQSTIDELLKKYQPNHPGIVELNQKIAKLKTSLANRPKEIADGISSRYLALKVKEEELNKMAEKENKSLLELEAKANEYKALQDDLKSKEATFGSFLDKVKNEYTPGLDILQLSIAEQAYVPHEKEKPFRSASILMGLIAGFIIGAGYNLSIARGSPIIEKTKPTEPPKEIKAQPPKGMYIERIKDEGEEKEK